MAMRAAGSAQPGRVAPQVRWPAGAAAPWGEPLAGLGRPFGTGPSGAVGPKPAPGPAGALGRPAPLAPPVGGEPLASRSRRGIQPGRWGASGGGWSLGCAIGGRRVLLDAGRPRSGGVAIPAA